MLVLFANVTVLFTIHCLSISYIFLVPLTAPCQIKRYRPDFCINASIFFEPPYSSEYFYRHFLI